MAKHLHGVCHTRKRIVIIGKIAILLFISLFFCSVNLISCAGLGDWEYELPNGYSIIRLNASTIIIGSDYKGYESSIIFERYITSFAYNEQYVCARRLDVPENYFFDDIMNMDFEEAEYLIIDTISHEIHSSLSKEEYQSLCKELNITGLCDWIDTYPDPEGAIY